jgi:hypothetical protein
MQAARWIGYVLAALLTPVAIGGLRAKSFLAREAAPLVAASLAPAPRAEPHDPRKPTVAIVLGADVTEITDMVAPYEMFARAGRYNVYAVAPTAASTTLTGGLRVRPHYSFEELDGLLEGAPPAIVVAPNVPNISSAENRPVVDWVRRSASQERLRSRGALARGCWPKQACSTVAQRPLIGVIWPASRRCIPRSSGSAAYAGWTTAAS